MSGEKQKNKKRIKNFESLLRFDKLEKRINKLFKKAKDEEE